MKDLWHYTCDHGRQALKDAGHVEPGSSLMPTRDDLPWQSYFAWFTDLATPAREPLGLTSNFIACDRTRYRYRVTDPSHIQPWTTVARTLRREQREDVELSPGARPAHWFLSILRVPVEFAPIRPQGSPS